MTRILGCFSTVLVGLLAITPATSQPASSVPTHCHTFSIVAYDPDKKVWGVGVASRVLAVGAIVPYAKSGVGAVATQAYTNQSYGPDGLKLLADGKSPEQIVKTLTEADKGREFRQLAVIDAKGDVANHTGKQCSKFAGSKTGKYYSCQGNLLASKKVIDDMAKAFEESKGPLAWRIMRSLKAAEKAGGDRRGKQSAAILVVGGRRSIDLRVDDHKEPLKELARILEKRIGK